jgi:hypothetical protein
VNQRAKKELVQALRVMVLKSWARFRVNVGGGMIVKLIAAAIVVGICGLSMSGVMAQQSTPPAVRVIQYEGDITLILATLPNAYGVTVGLELDTQRYHSVGVSLLDPTVTDVLNAVVQSSKKYEWRQIGGFVDVWPLAGSNPLLETRLNSFEVKDLSPSEAFDELLNLPEVQANMTALKLKRRAPDVSPAKLRSSRFSVNLEGVTLRDALNKIAQQSRIGIWIFRNYPNGLFSISSVES